MRRAYTYEEVKKLVNLLDEEERKNAKKKLKTIKFDPEMVNKYGYKIQKKLAFSLASDLRLVRELKSDLEIITNEYLKIFLTAAKAKEDGLVTLEDSVEIDNLCLKVGHSLSEYEDSIDEKFAEICRKSSKIAEILEQNDEGFGYGYRKEDE